MVQKTIISLKMNIELLKATQYGGSLVYRKNQLIKIYLPTRKSCHFGQRLIKKNSKKKEF